MVIPYCWVNSYALLTRAPLSTRPKSSFTFDLHVLGLPPAFVLSQDQTLKLSLPAQTRLSLSARESGLEQTCVCDSSSNLRPPPPTHLFQIYNVKEQTTAPEARAPAAVEARFIRPAPTPVKRFSRLFSTASRRSQNYRPRPDPLQVARIGNSQFSADLAEPAHRFGGFAGTIEAVAQKGHDLDVVA